ncbi:MAG: 2,3-diphosphoglycerate-dependent phosphoglycerate mutase [Ignavibacteriae bacterium]|nr:2,3-diphosphoglycerate-dependent phosphoglycerate mutase [Ignavibacteriota bacterium]MCB9215595.1 2,3-diphosphoglycerate-dependent phosphoglycerate mutase [Ignavibacteria bacterium]
MPDLILLRHGQSQWNLENRFTGWVDIDLSEKGREEAQSAGEKLRDIQIDVVYTSVLQRAINTAKIALEAAGKGEMELIQDQALNERHYGDLQGLNKAETAEKYGDEQVHIWRRSFDVRPPGDEAESLELTIERVLPYYHEHIEKDLLAGKNVLVVAHGNSLRSLSYYLDKHTPDSIVKLEIPTGAPILYKLNVGESGLEVAEREAL